MFGISGAEFLVILIVAVAVIPSRHWPDVARALARMVTWVRRMVWKITDASEQIRNQIELERPLDEIIQTTTDDMLDGISSRRTTTKKRRRK